MPPKQLLRQPIIFLKEGVDTSQGQAQIISNINACQAVVEIIRSTLGPHGMDKLICAENGALTITNDGATVIDLLDIVHPAVRVLVEIAKSQDAEVGDGTTSVLLLAGELLQEAKAFLDEKVAPYTIVQGYQKACEAAQTYLDTIKITISEQTPEEKFQTLIKCAETSLNSKLLAEYKKHFSKLVVDAVMETSMDRFDASLIGFKKVPGGSLCSSELINGVAFKKTFSYAGFELQPKAIKNPKILLLNIELELKAEKDNAEVRVSDPEAYASIIDAEWKIIFDKLEKIVQTGAQVVLSRLPIGDLATQYFADHDVFCAGRVEDSDMKRTAMATGGKVQSTVTDLMPEVFGTCESFEEVQIGSSRYNVFRNCVKTKSVTFILRGGAQQLLDEAERSLNDAIMCVHRTLRSNAFVAGGGAAEMCLSTYLRSMSSCFTGKFPLIFKAFAKALECIPRTLIQNAGLDQISLMKELREKHNVDAGKDSARTWAGFNSNTNAINDTLQALIWEPVLIKSNVLSAATEAACLILTIDETVKNPRSQTPQTAAGQAMAGRAG